MSLLSTLTTDASIAGEKDTLGGGNNLFESGIYKGVVTLAYLTKAASDAVAVNLVLKTEDGRELKQAVYITSGKDKGCKNTYTDKDGNPQYLPGFLMINSLSQLTTGKELSQLATEQKVVNVYSFDAKADIPTKVEALTEIMGQEVYAAVLKQTEDKRKKNEATGQYEATGETVDRNEIDKFFCAKEGHDKKTTAEIRAQSEAVFFGQWAEKNTGKTRNKAKGAGANAPKAGAPAAAAGAAKPSQSLFG